MNKYNTLTIRHFVVILVSIFLFSFISTNLFYFNTLQKIRINGSLYFDLKKSKELKADILPPRLYIVDTFLLVYELVDEQNQNTQKALMSKISNHKKQYYDYYNYWKKNISKNEIFDLLIIKSHKHVDRFFTTYEDKLIPAIKNNNDLLANKIVLQDLKPSFDLHRKHIDEAAILIQKSSHRIETNSQEVSNSSSKVIISIFVISIVFTLLVSFTITARVKKIEENIISSKNETEHANVILKSIVSDLKRFNHNFDNIIASTKGFLLKKEYISLDSYLDEISNNSSHRKLVNYTQLDKIKNPAIFGLLISKIEYAESKTVTFKILINDEFSTTMIKIAHLSEILGILLDNAIEASSESIKKTVCLRISGASNELSFEVTNSILNIPDQSRMFHKGFSTKGSGRGLGLSIVNNLIAKYDNVTLNTFVDDNFVTQELLILKNSRSRILSQPTRISI